MRLNWNPPQFNDRTAHLVSGAPHSIHVVFGAERVDGSKMPARDFFELAIANTDLEATFVEVFHQTGDSDAAFEAICDELHEAIKTAIQDPQWEWDRETYRQYAKELVTSPRNIVDSKELLESQTIEYQD